MSLEGAIATQRFGLGARPGEIARASANPKAWLLAQIAGPAPQPPAPPDGFATAGRLVSEEEEYKAEKVKNKPAKAARQEAEAKGESVPPKPPKDNIRKEIWFAEMGARMALGCTTDKPFAERLVRFWSNHFTVSTAKRKVMTFAGSYEREAIRPHIAGSFEDMLFAVCMHPAMQIYLDNWHSIGPNSPAAQKGGGKKGLNENLGRELMELYSLGVDGGYSQADVIAMAKLLTGWGIYDGRPSGFGFNEARHEPGEIVLRGKTYPAGWDGSVAAIKDLAHDPATAHHIATKFATHFIADDPPKESVARLEKVFNDTRGDLHALSETVVKDANAWHPELRKFRPPVEYVTATLRAAGWNGDGENRDKQMRRLLGAVRVMGEVPFAAPSPKGWDDNADAWAGSDALLDRIEWAKQFAQGLPDANAARLAEDGLGPLLTPNTKSVLAKAGSKSEAVALLLASPEFQRR
ncbi:MAG: DUF1800 domain-containing protein [Alphaproteobacteria bacterium]|nr:DUF1800 domain-containing protein [Alphaproteobacteria bacterium]MBV9692856.1 DUF1800 domain-containing protein [Alphaproteobacteria bacterium]